MQESVPNTAVKNLVIVLAMITLAACGSQPAAGSPGGPTLSPQASKVVVRDYGPPPVGVPLFYVKDPRHDKWFIGLDWSGVPRGTIKLEQAALGTQAPDGSAFAYASNGKGGGPDVFRDRLGALISDADATPYAGALWADDSKGLCVLAFINREWLVGLKTPGSVPSLHRVAIDSSVVASGIIAMSVAACSPRHDRAVLVRNYWGIEPQVWVVRISDGAVLRQWALPRYEISDISASPDASLIAENSSKANGYVGTAAANSIVRRAGDGSVVARLDPSLGVVAFSSDDSVALVTTSRWVSGSPTHLGLARLANGAMLWRYDGSEEYSSRNVQPGGSEIAVLLQTPGVGPSAGPTDVVIVRGDGSAISQRFN
jgi:hypothetical protein